VGVACHCLLPLCVRAGRCRSWFQGFGFCDSSACMHLVFGTDGWLCRPGMAGSHHQSVSSHFRMHRGLVFVAFAARGHPGRWVYEIDMSAQLLVSQLTMRPLAGVERAALCLAVIFVVVGIAMLLAPREALVWHQGYRY